ncbi:hypothetical protein ADL27_56965 [Streptomyces sp. NRRL F-6602]|nr:hypothetical protein ADL27_56965 [Streptomyces sp. NRRL F-6602]
MDMDPAAHKALKRWALAAALDLDRTTVPLAQVLRVLAAELTADDAQQLPGLADRVRERLAAGTEAQYPQ